MHNTTAITTGSAKPAAQYPVYIVLGCGLTSIFGGSKIPIQHIVKKFPDGYFY